MGGLILTHLIMWPLGNNEKIKANLYMWRPGMTKHSAFWATRSFNSFENVIFIISDKLQKSTYAQNRLSTENLAKQETDHQSKY